jgi:hypothetical protein
MAPCAFVDVIKRHIPAVMQLVGARLRDHYFMGMITTKCLNTAVMMVYLLCGAESMNAIKQCDTDVVKSRFKATVTRGASDDGRVKTMQSLRDALLYEMPTTPSVFNRDIFYVMLTHSVLPRHDGNSPPTNINDFANNATVNSSKGERMFPGHVFVIERSWIKNTNTFTPRYSIYQSYIGEYDLGEFIHKNPSLINMNTDKMTGILNGLVDLMQTPVWTAKNSLLWNELTTVSLKTCKGFEGFVIGGRILPCFRKLSIDQCTLTFNKLVNDAINTLETQCPKSISGSAVYGPQNLYNISSKTYQRTPLSCAEMQAELKVISAELSASSLSQASSRSSTAAVPAAKVAKESSRSIASAAPAAKRSGGSRKRNVQSKLPNSTTNPLILARRLGSQQ